MGGPFHSCSMALARGLPWPWSWRANNPCRHDAKNEVPGMPMLGFMPQRQDGVLARGLRQPIRLGIERFPPPCAGIGGDP